MEGVRADVDGDDLRFTCDFGREVLRRGPVEATLDDGRWTLRGQGAVHMPQTVTLRKRDCDIIHDIEAHVFGHTR